MAATSTAPLLRSASQALDKWLRTQAAKSRLPLMAAVIISATSGLLLIAQAWFLAHIVNAIVIEDRRLNQVWSWLWVLLGIFVIRALLAAMSEATAFEAAARVKTAVRSRLYAHIERLGPVWLNQQRTGNLVNTLVDSIEAIEQYYSRYLPQTALAVFIPLAILVFVFPSDWISGLILLVTAPLIPFFMILIGKGAERLNQRQWRKLARISAHFFDVIEGLTTLKLFNASRAESNVVAQISDEYRRSTMAVLRVAFLSSLVLEFFATVSIAMVAVFIGFRLYYHQMYFLPGFFVLLLAPEFYRPLRNMGTHYHTRMEAIGASEQIVELFNTPLPEKPIPRTDLPSSHEPVHIRFEHVSFGYDTQQTVLSGINFSFGHGERIALIGPSGVGKTTLSQLLLGFINPTHGVIRINGINLADVPEHQWLKRVAWVPQHPTLFHGSVRHNIVLGQEAVPEEAMYEAAQLANAAAFIDALPQKYDTIIGERGQGLSGGQIQRIALARAFLKNADLVVLDEASANLDPETEAQIIESTERLAQNCAFLVIAHRLDTVRKADHIIVLKQGRIVEQGDHDSLINQGGFYTQMYARYRGIRT